MSPVAPFIRLHPSDDVVIARAQLVGGTPIENIVSRGLIPPGHKVAMRAIAAGEPVRRYDQIIGFASQPIAPVRVGFVLVMTVPAAADTCSPAIASQGR